MTEGREQFNPQIVELLSPKESTRVVEGREERMFDGGILDEEQNIIGDFTARELPGKKAYLKWISIYDEFQNKGYGRLAHIKIGNYLASHGLSMLSGRLSHENSRKIWEHFYKEGFATKQEPFSSGEEFVGEYELVKIPAN